MPEYIERGILLKRIESHLALDRKTIGKKQFADGFYLGLSEAEIMVAQAPTVDVLELPKGRPGDYLEWDNGTGFRQFYAIDSIMICRDCVRYELANMAPVVNHKNIIRILKEPEMKRIVEEKWAKVKAEDQQTYFSAPDAIGEGS